MGLKVTNNAFGTLNAGINSSVTTIVLSAGEGARFPTLTAGDYFYATLIDTSNNLEIVKVTARSTDTMTVVRAQDNTTARAFSTNDRFELRPTAILFNEKANAADVAATYVELAGDTMTGKLTIQATSYTLKLDGTSRSDIELVHTSAGSNLKRRIIRSIDGEFRLGLEDDASTSYTNHLNIDSSGRVTMPLQPSFYAKNQPSVAAVNTIVGGTIDHNVGSCYNSSTGRFTAPVSGYYYVAFGVLTAISNDRVELNLYKNGGLHVRANESTGSTSPYGGAFSSVVMYLAANDYIYFQISLGIMYNAHENNIFSARLLG